MDYWQGGVSCISGTLSGVSVTISDLNNPLKLRRLYPKNVVLYITNDSDTIFRKIKQSYRYVHLEKVLTFCSWWGIGESNSYAEGI